VLVRNSHRRRLSLTGVACAAGLAVLTGCGSSATESPDSDAGTGAAGGTLYYINARPYQHLDPQRIYYNHIQAFASRTFVRTLTTFMPSATDPTELTGDAATDIGTSSDGARTWTFQLRDGVSWQDGKPVTCADYKYGISRGFATDQITSGPHYAMAYLDIPSADGVSAYKGPYDKTGQELYDEAVECTDDKTIVFHLKDPVADFNFTVALPGFGAVREDQDTGAKFDFTMFSDGPYMLEGTWDPKAGGTLVRNPKWDPASDPIRKALPDKIVVLQGLNEQTISQRLLADNGDDQYAITHTQVDPSVIPQILGNPTAKDRAANEIGGFVDYLTVNVKHIPEPEVRQALIVATDKVAYRAAMGGETYGEFANTVMSKTVAGWKDFNVFDTKPEGDTAEAKKLLESAGVEMPYPITYAFQQSPVQDKAASAFKAAWEKAGFAVTLKPLGSDYYDVLANPSETPDVAWSSWVADWPSGSTDIPALFDSRINLTAESLGYDFGEFDDAEVNAKIDEARQETDKAAQDKMWGELDEMVNERAAVVPLIHQKYFYLSGSKVKGLTYFFGGYPDISNVSVK
jgi:peptide/nickel transport system substrate-binding protein